jgi:hypothetical protein
MRTHGLRGIILLLLLSWSCSGSPTARSRFFSVFIGSWQNADSQTRGLPQIVIRSQSGLVYVHTWGACVPINCDWGEVQAQQPSSGTLSASFNSGFQLDSQTLTISANGHLQSVTHTHFADGSGRPDVDELDVFNRSGFITS